MRSTWLRDLFPTSRTRRPVRRVRPMAEALETRAVPAVTITDNANFVVMITANENVSILDGPVGKVRVVVDGTNMDQNTLSNAVTNITVTATGNFPNTIDLSGVTRAAAFPAVATVTVDAGAGDDAVTGSDGADGLDGNDGNDTLVGFRGGDTMTGGLGNDVLIWNNGDGSDVMDGQIGADTVRVNGSPTAGDAFQVTPSGTRTRFDRTNLGTFNLDIGTTETLELNTLGGDDTITVLDLMGIADLTAINANGGDGNDTITAAALTAGIVTVVASGGDGNDTITGSFGADVLNGGTGNDTLIGFKGNDTFVGGSDSANFWTVDANNNLIRYTVNGANVVADRSVAVTGLQAAENILGIDFRPATGQLFGLGSTSRLYTFDLATGAATQVGTGQFATPLSGTAFGFDFNPTVDRIRVVSDSGQNLRLNPDTGALVAVDTTLSGAAGLVGSAYTNSFAGSKTTALFGIDAATDKLFLQGGATGTPSPNGGVLTPIGALGFDADTQLGFDIIPGQNNAFATLTVGGVSGLYQINLTTGAASLVGNVGMISGMTPVIRGMAILPDDDTMIWNNGDGSDIMDGQLGQDTVQVNGSATAGDAFDVTVNGTRTKFARTNLGTFTLDIGTTETLTMNTLGGDDTITVNDLTGALDLQLVNMNGFEGNDVLTANGLPGGLVTINANGGEGNDVITGSAGADILVGDSGNDTITGFKGSDTFVGGPGEASFLGLDSTNQLIRFVANGSNVIATRFVAITGLQAGENVLGIDFRPATGQLYGLGSTSRLYTIDANTGVATVVGGQFSTLLSGVAFGFDFNPTVDRIRVVSDNGQNLRLHPDTGALVMIDTPLTSSGGLVGSAYTNNFVGTKTTTLFGIDAANDKLVLQGGVDGSPSPNGGAITVIGALGVNTDNLVGFDIITGTKGAFATLTVGGVTGLYQIDLTTGAATLIGNVGMVNGATPMLRGMALLPDDDIMIWNNGDGSDIMDGAFGQDTVQVNGNDSAGDTFTVASNGTRTAFNRTNLVPFSLDIGTSEVLQLNGQGGDDSMTVNDLSGVADLVRIDLSGGDGNDMLSGAALLAGPTGLTADGGIGDDLIVGSAGANVLIGGDGKDNITGGKGADSVTGGNGDDLLIWNNGDGSDLLDGEAGNDTVRVNGSPTSGDTFTVVVNGVRTKFDRTNLVPFTLDIGTAESLEVNGLDGADSLTTPPFAGMSIAFDGGTPGFLDAAGDTLTVDTTGVTGTKLAGTTNGAGQLTFTGLQPISFASVEKLTPGVTITGSVFNDANGNGVLDTGEAPLAGIPVTLNANADGTIEQTTTSKADGTFSFGDLPPGSYRVRLGTLSGSQTQTSMNPADIAATDTAPTALAFGVQTKTGTGGGKAELPPGPVLIGGSDNGSTVVFNPSSGTFVAGDTITFPGLSGAVRTALADVNGDGTDDFIGGSAPGTVTRVVILDGKTKAVLADIQPYITAYTGGIYVASADFNGDGKAELAVSPDLPGIGPLVEIFDGATLTGGTKSPTLFSSFLGLASLNGEADTSFMGGARVGISDVNGDGTPDLVVGAGNTGGPRITVWNGKGFASANSGNPTIAPIANLFVFENTQRDGAYVAGGDVTGDGFSDLVFGGGPGGGPRIRIVDGARLLALPNLEAVNLDDPANLVSGLVLNNFFAGDVNSRGGIRVTLRDLDGDTLADLVTGSGDGLPSSVRVYTGTALAAVRGPANDGKEPALAQGLIDPFNATLTNGVFVG